ncbi:hypothetical protein [Actinoplanes sp. L3-i22]|uniref:hypothetical protein n=1 Tax=Actinoplanes sp. L3-i22 TaxID=2836373 RepID=UPI001C767D36|nr:hypothetical protein [Actinoplanes sp. L3-i22]BCY14188.1 hypothetical protein L3i22_092760 [Actinoplanes sp. L3-i22]
MRRLIAAAPTGDLRAEHAWAVVAVDARRQPPPPPDPAVVASYLGRYDTAEVCLRDGELWLIRPQTYRRAA